MILLGFDVEEFDLPFEYGKTISFEDQIAVSTNGVLAVLALLKETNIKATFYCTAAYAKNRADIVKAMVSDGHEIASHGYCHSDFKPEHLKQSKNVLEAISGTEVKGFRMARMMPVNEHEICKAGYLYNSSLNPTFLPGRYNNLNKPRTSFFINRVLQIPVSVSPCLRFPLFWLTFHNIPLSIIKKLCIKTHKKDGYLNLYFHPWEFTDLKNKDKFGLPFYISNHSGEAFLLRIKNFIIWAQSEGYVFEKTCDFAGRVSGL